MNAPLLSPTHIKALIGGAPAAPPPPASSCANCHWSSFRFGTAPNERTHCELNDYAWPVNHTCDDYGVI